MEAYKVWEQDTGLVEALHPSVEKHDTKNNEREAHEQAIAASAQDPTALLAAWHAYVQYEEKQIGRSNSDTATILQRTPSVHASRERERVRCTFERAVNQCCLYPAIWQSYLTWEVEGGELSRALVVYQRAVRNCPFSAELWVAYALFTEETADFSHAGGDQEEAKVDKVYLDAAGHVGYYSAQTLRQVSLSRCDYLRRRFLRHVPAKNAAIAAPFVEKEREALRQEFDELAAVLSAKEDPGGARAVQLYRAELEALVFRMVPRAVQVWEQALKTCSDDAEAWLSVVDILRAIREVGHARALLKRGANVLQLVSKEQPKGVSAASMVAYMARWVEFERREGDVDTYKVALAKYTSLAHLVPAASAGAVGGGKMRDKSRANKGSGDSEDPAKAARREEVMKKWAERKALEEAGGAAPKGTCVWIYTETHIGIDRHGHGHTGIPAQT